MVYREGGRLFVGVTYETERQFKWLREITDAWPTGLAVVKITAFVMETSPETSVIDGTNDSQVNLIYEAVDTDHSTIVFASFNYMTGTVTSLQRINKGTNEMANNMVIAYVIGAPKMDQSGGSVANELSVLSLVMSFPSNKAYEIQFGVSTSLPSALRMLDFRAHSGASSGFTNTDY